MVENLKFGSLKGESSVRSRNKPVRKKLFWSLLLPALGILSSFLPCDAPNAKPANRCSISTAQKNRQLSITTKWLAAIFYFTKRGADITTESRKEYYKQIADMWVSKDSVFSAEAKMNRKKYGVSMLELAVFKGKKGSNVVELKKGSDFHFSLAELVRRYRSNYGTSPKSVSVFFEPASLTRSMRVYVFPAKEWNIYPGMPFALYKYNLRNKSACYEGMGHIR